MEKLGLIAVEKGKFVQFAAENNYFTGTDDAFYYYYYLLILYLMFLLLYLCVMCVCRISIKITYLLTYLLI